MATTVGIGGISSIGEGTARWLVVPGEIANGKGETTRVTVESAWVSARSSAPLAKALRELQPIITKGINRSSYDIGYT